MRFRHRTWRSRSPILDCRAVLQSVLLGRTQPEKRMRDVWSPAQETPRETYATICSEFRWRIPATFNFGADVVDRWARERDGSALIWQDAAGNSRR